MGRKLVAIGFLSFVMGWALADPLVEPEPIEAVMVSPQPIPVLSPSLGPTEEVVPVPVPAFPPEETVYGIASWMPEKYGDRYLALPEGAGVLVRICGANCIRIRSMDTGPNQRIHPDRVADLAVRLWEHVCGLPRSRGLCYVTVTFLKEQ